MLEIGLRDGSFPHQCSATLMGDNAQECPKSFRWAREQVRPVTFYTDMRLDQAKHDDAAIKVAWLLEAPPFRTKHYDYALEHQDEFDYILTYVREFLGGKWLFCPHGGSRIPLDKWKVYDKTKGISLLASFKDQATGHRLRHTIKDALGDRLDVMGSIVGEPVGKMALAPYRYSIVVAAERLDWCFSDHLIDCLSVGTVPIYWGCPDIGRFFETDGIIQFETVDELCKILNSSLLTEMHYRSKLEAVQENLERAKQYRCIEDWIFGNHPELFKTMVGLQHGSQ